MKTVFAHTEEKMKKRLDVLRTNFSEIRAGRANPAVLDRVSVDYYGTATPINQMASVQVTEAHIMVIQPYDASILRAIEKAIQASDIGINPQNDGKIIRMVFPPLTEERRRDLTKDIAKMGEEAKVSIRAFRHDAIHKLKEMKKASEISEDDLKLGEKTIQDLTDKYCKESDTLSGKKEKEIMEI